MPEFQVLKVFKDSKTLIKAFPLEGRDEQEVKEEALRFGEEYFNSSNERMTLICIKTSNLPNRYNLYKTWW